jgi:hypothetical protein
MRRRYRRPGFFFTACVLSSIACSGATTVCTLIGCESGVTVHLASLPNGPFRVDVKPRGASDVAYVYECSDGAHCQQNIFFPGLITDYLTVTVQAGAASRDTEVVQIQYTSHRPNGPNCEPDCRTATVTAQVPG